MAALGIVLFVIGAILTWGINLVVDGVDLLAVGAILMVVGAVAFLAGLATSYRGRSRVTAERHVSADGRHVVEESSSRL
jgi:hypothetical protein